MIERKETKVLEQESTGKDPGVNFFDPTDV